MFSSYQFNQNHIVMIFIITIPIFASYKIFEISNELNIVKKNLILYNEITNAIFQHHNKHKNYYIKNNNTEYLINNKYFYKIVIKKENMTTVFQYYINKKISKNKLNKIPILSGQFAIVQDGVFYNHKKFNITETNNYDYVYIINQQQNIGNITHKLIQNNFISNIINTSNKKIIVNKINCFEKNNRFAVKILNPTTNKYSINTTENSNNIQINIDIQNNINTLQVIQYCG